VLWQVKLLSTSYYTDHEPVYVDVLDGTGKVLGTTQLKENTNISANENGYFFINPSDGHDGKLSFNVNGETKAYSKGQYASWQFRDNDEWKVSIDFELASSTVLKIQLRRADISRLAPYVDFYFTQIDPNEQSFIAFDNFNLIYHGTNKKDEPWKDLYYDRVKAVYDATKDKVDALDDFKMEGCNHNSVWTSTCKVTLDTTNKIASLNGNKIDTESEFLEALSNIEAAYQAALAEHRKHHLVLDQNSTTLPEINNKFKSVTVKRPITAGNWFTFVVPFKISATDVSKFGWDVRELVSSRADVADADGKQNVTLTFAKVDEIEANTPYMIKATKAIDNQFTVKNVTVNNTNAANAKTVIYGVDANSTIDDVRFVGVYTKRYMTPGVYFVNNNNKYKKVVKENTNLIRGYRAYIELLDKNAKSIEYRWGEGETAIEEVEEEPTVVAIYNTRGVRLNDMQEGVNILQMSDGTTVKVVIK
jgi:hypothetical protein